MKAVYANGTNYDDPLSVLEVGTMPEPETKPFWSTIRVNSASVNHHDVWSLQGVERDLRPVPKWSCIPSLVPMAPV